MSGASPSPPSLRTNGLSLYTPVTLADIDTNLTWPEPADVDEVLKQDPDTSDLQKESLEMGDNTLSPVPASQRKLPIPNTSANSNSNLKGMLIKPKRILPAQPDTSKTKRAQQESGSQIKPHTTEDLKSPLEEVNTAESVKNNSEPPHKQTVLPKLQIDVGRLKTYFLTHGSDGAEGRKSAVNGKDFGLKKSGSLQSPGGYIPHTNLTRESSLYTFNPDGFAKVREWCSPNEINRVASKMSASENTLGKDRNIRSPSPKSNTTWDRSSSGYSSDERADPRSPPPRDSASVVSKTESAEYDISSVSTDKCEEDDHTCEDVTDTVDQVICANDSGDSDDSDNDTCGGEDAGSDIEPSVVKDSSNVCSCAVSDGANNSVDKTDQNQNNVVSKDENMSLLVPVITNVDNSTGIKQTNRRPTWQLANTPASGRIQYRKSTSESLISLRHPSRQGLTVDNNNYDGLEVCGKSYPQVPNNTTKTDSFVADCGKNDAAPRDDSSTPLSAFMQVEKSVVAPEIVVEPVVPKLDLHKQESVFKTRPMRKQFAPPRSPRAIKNLSLSLAGTLTVGRDEKDIRKTLHDLNSPRRSPGGQTAPIRARHIIHPTSGNTNQPMKVTEAMTGQPMGLAFTGFQGINTVSDSKPGIKFFGKKMWRAPQGQPENAQMRPFSPFGGTLPPSKIKENAHRKCDDETDT